MPAKGPIKLIVKQPGTKITIKNPPTRFDTLKDGSKRINNAKQIAIKKKEETELMNWVKKNRMKREWVHMEYAISKGIGHEMQLAMTLNRLEEFFEVINNGDPTTIKLRAHNYIRRVINEINIYKKRTGKSKMKGLL